MHIHLTNYFVCWWLVPVAALMELEYVNFSLCRLFFFVQHAFKMPLFSAVYTSFTSTTSTFFTSVSCIPTFATCFVFFGYWCTLLVAIYYVNLWNFVAIVFYYYGISIASAYSVDDIIEIWAWYVWFNLFGMLICTLSSLISL